MYHFPYATRMALSSISSHRLPLFHYCYMIHIPLRQLDHRHLTDHLHLLAILVVVSNVASVNLGAKVLAANVLYRHKQSRLAIQLLIRL